MVTTSAPSRVDHAPGLAQRIRSSRFSPFVALVWLLGLLIALAILYPIIRMVVDVFFPGGQPTIQPFIDAFAIKDIWTGAGLNTLIIVGCSSVLALAIAVVFAWLNERTNARIGFIAGVLPLMPLFIPQVAAAAGWVFLLSPQAGLLNVTLRDLFGISFSVFSLPGLTMIYTLTLVPFAYLPISSALANLDSSLEEAARINGSGRLGVLLRVTLPAIKPAIATGFLFTVVVGFAMVSIPVIVGTIGGIDVLPTVIYRGLTASYPPQTGIAAVLILPMLLVIFAVWMLQRWVIRGGNYATIGGRGARHAPTDLGGWRWPARVGMALYILIAAVVPFLGLLYMSFQPFWAPEWNFENLRIDSYRNVFFENTVTLNALRNSLTFGLIAAVVCTVVAMLLATYTVRSRSRAAGVIDGVVKLPATISHLLIGVAMLAAFSVPPFQWNGTSQIVILAYVLIFMPNSSLLINSSYAEIGPELAEASAISGAGRTSTFMHITLPLLRRGAAAAVAMIFVFVLNEVTVSALLGSTRTPVVGSVMLDLWQSGTFPLISALGVGMTLVAATVAIVVLRLGTTKANA